MVGKSFLIISLLMGLAVSVKGQIVNTIYRNLGTLCEDELFLISEDFFSTYQVAGSCGQSVVSLSDRSSEIEVIGEGLMEERVRIAIESPYATSPILHMMYQFRAVAGAKEITVKCRSTVISDKSENCQPQDEDYYIERIYIFNFEVIPTPATPSLSLDRYAGPNSVEFQASGCPANPNDSPYVWNETLCRTNADEVFIRGEEDGTRSGTSGYSYRVACKVGKCIGPPSEFKTGIAYNPPDPGQVPEEIRNHISSIDNIRNSIFRPDYHNYELETVICNTQTDPNCTMNAVFQLMLSSNQFIAPITRDMRGFGSGSSWFSFDNLAPVQSYEMVDLSGLLIRFLIETDISVLNYIAEMLGNPVMTYIDWQTYTTLNYTLPSHVLSPGKVARKVVQKCDNIYILTIGEGLSKWTTQPELLAECPECALTIGILTGMINSYEGRNLFIKVDNRLRSAYNSKYHE